MGVAFLKRFFRVLTAAALAALMLCSGALCAPEPAASCAVLMDAESGRVLYARQLHARRPIASITKLMTALVAVERFPGLEREVTVQPEWLGSEGSSIYLHAGEKITVRGLLYGLLLQSGNDAAMVLACAAAGTEERFADWMNERAAALGMVDTHFVNPSGLDAADHYSSAYDMALLAAACLENEVVAEICAAKSAAVGTRTFYNHNRLLSRYPGCIGMKTGYTERSGRTLVSAARREEQTLICVTLNDPDDWNDHTALLDYGFSAYPARLLCGQGEVLGAVPVSGSIVPSAAAAAADTVRFPLGEGERLECVVETIPALTAPVARGAAAGRVVWLLNGVQVAETELVCAGPVAEDRVRRARPGRRIIDWLFALVKRGDGTEEER